MSRNVVIIPARWGSTRFPGKPLYEIAGKPLLRHVWERCRRARKIDTTIVATDDMRIAEAAFAWRGGRPHFAHTSEWNGSHCRGSKTLEEIFDHCQRPGRRAAGRSAID